MQVLGRAISAFRRNDLHEAAQGLLSLGVEIYQVRPVSTALVPSQHTHTSTLTPPPPPRTCPGCPDLNAVPTRCTTMVACVYGGPSASTARCTRVRH
jgi:hypothetical protein